MKFRAIQTHILYFQNMNVNRGFIFTVILPVFITSLTASSFRKEPHLHMFISLTNSQHIRVSFTSSESSLSYISLSTVNYEKIKTRICKHNYISNSIIYGTTKSVLKYHCFQNELMRLKRKIQVIKQFIVYFVFATHGSPMLYTTWSSIIQKSLV